MDTEQLKKAAMDIASEEHCRYCDGENTDPRLKCPQDIKFAAERIVSLVETYAEELLAGAAQPGDAPRNESWGFSGNMIVLPKEGCAICGGEGHPNATCPKAPGDAPQKEKP